METPKDDAGRLTEQIMAHFYENFELETADYNKAWSHVYNTLSQYFAKRLVQR